MGLSRRTWVLGQVTPPLECYRVHHVTPRDPPPLKGDKKILLLFSVELRGFAILIYLT